MGKKALYLAGGGARGAYQAGVLKGINYILQPKKLPFDMVAGVSVGSINAAILATYAQDFSLAVEKLESIWGNITCQQVFHASNYELSKSVIRNLMRVVIKQPHTGHLLDTQPLQNFIAEHIDFELIKDNIVNKHLEVMEVISHCYETGQTISFYQHHPEEKLAGWHNPRHASHSTSLSINHILASSALPLFFPTVRLDGFHYGDGSMGLISPLRGGIRFKMDKILIIGTRQPPVFSVEPEVPKNERVGFAHILGGMLNGLFLDNLDRDIETVNHMNEIARMISLWKKRHSPWRPIDTLHLRPSIDISDVAESQFESMPTLLRLLLNGMGAKEHSGDLLSFLLFERTFARELIKLGYQDTLAIRSEINQFFRK